MAEFTPTADAWISPGGNSGTGGMIQFGNILTLGNPVALRSLLRFDLSGAGLTANARGRLRLTRLGGNLPAGISTFQLLHVTQLGWTESATWPTYDGTNNWSTAGGNYVVSPLAVATIPDNSQSIVFEFGVTPGVGILNLIIRGVEGEGFSRYLQVHSRESLTVAARPTIELASYRGCVSISDVPLTNLIISDEGCAA